MRTSIAKNQIVTTLISAITILLFFNCKPLMEKEFGFKNEIEGHFDKMDYVKIASGKESSIGNHKNFVLTKGVGNLIQKDGMRLAYKWADIIDKNGELIGLFVGTPHTKSSSNVAQLTKGESMTRYRACRRLGGDSADDCVDTLVKDIIKDCEELGGNHCWFEKKN